LIGLKINFIKLNFFKNLFSGKEKREESLIKDFSEIGIDMHSHFIPGIDDGAATIQDSIDLIRKMVNFGYKKIYTTPHIMSDYYKNTPEIILSGLEKVREAIKQNGIPVELYAAAEYYCDFEFSSKIGKEKLLTFGDNYILFEVSYLNAPENISDIIFMLQSNGYRPVLAHPERYPYWFSNYKIYSQLKEKGALLQLNINSLTGYYSPATKKIGEKLIADNLIDFIGSDCHHAGHINLMHQAIKNPSLKTLIESGNLKNKFL
jgi:tyrosine-protein phosphatase YwqE